MAIQPVAVAYKNMLETVNGPVTPTATGTSWVNPDRMYDRVRSRLAKTAAIPSGISAIVIDQGPTVGDYLSPGIVILGPSHNLASGSPITVEYNSADSWPGTTVTSLETSGTLTAGIAWWNRFSQVTAGAGNRYWRISFTKTDAIPEIGELFLSTRIVLGQSELVEDGGATSPAEFPITRNIVVARTLAGVRTSTKLGVERRSFNLRASALNATAKSDWHSFLVGIEWGHLPFFFHDPINDMWFAEGDLRGRSLDNPERWDMQIDLEEVV